MIGLGTLIDFGPVPIPAPHINAVTPSLAFASASTSVTIDGTGFVTGATVTVDGVPATSVVVVSPTEITCTFPPEGGRGVPVVSAVSFGVVDTDGGGRRVVVTVDDSTGCTSITAGGVAFTSFAIDDSTHVSGVPGAHAAGVVDVVVTNGVGDSTTGTGLIKYWTPSHVTGSPLWFDAERGVTEVAAAVSAWAEQSAGVVNATQSTGANKPTWTASAFGSLHSLLFSKGGPSFMNVAGQTVSSGDAITWRAGIKTTDATATATDAPGVNPANTIMGGSSGGGACNAGIGGDGTADTVNSRSYDGANWQLAAGGASVNDGNPHVIGVNVDGTSKAIQCVQDGAVVGTGTLGASGFVDVAGWDTIGAGFADDDSYQGHLAFFFYMPSAISGPDDSDLTAWSAQRWGTPSAAPFDPLSVAGCALWYSAAHATTSMGGVTALPDQSGNARDAALTGVLAYTATNAAYNNGPTINRTDATDQILSPDLGLTTGPFTFVYVGDAPTAVANFLMRIIGGGIGVDIRAQSSKYRASANGGGTELEDTVADTTVPVVLVVVYNGVSSKLFASALTPIAGDAGALPDLTGLGVYVGAPAADGFGDLNFRHALVYSGAMSDVDAGYLLNGFGAESSITIGA